ncbi:DUF6658 family protein [Coleofasciculus sp. H7-2]|uniref:DUF6658 family protein n=1 Tax=Coleofasciculus sp. H7-2 TaxID=3351545 RepID=UPI00366BA1C5
MKHLTAFFKKLRLGQILTVFLAGVLLIVTTACNNGDSLGARPQNPPVQMGGNNNPHKNGGDGYTNYKMSTDPNISKTANPRDRADLQILSNQLIATSNSEILYPGAETPQGRLEKERELPIKTSDDFTQPKPGGLNQRNSDIGERVGNRLEKVGEEFKDASSFIKDKSDEAGQRPELQSNPTLHK